MTSPLVSVICPTFNRSRRILPTLRSVRNQRFTDWELLVVSDGSTDDTDDVLAACAREDDRIRPLRTPRHGHPSPVRQAGLARARGGIVAYLDHDDTWLPDHLASLVAAVERGADVVATGAVRVGPDGRVTSVTGPLDLLWHPELQLASPLFEPSRVAHRAGLSAAVGGWRALASGLEDWDLWLRLADAGARFATVDARSARLADGGPSRRTRVPRGHQLWLAEFPTAAAAARAVAGLRAPGAAAELRAAARADQLVWYRSLAATGDLRWPEPHQPHGPPAGGDARPASVTELVERAFAAAGPGAVPWPELVVRREPRSDVATVRVGLPLWCGTAEHAARLRELLWRRQPAQLALTQRVLGGGPVEGDERKREREGNDRSIPAGGSVALATR